MLVEETSLDSILISSEASDGSGFAIALAFGRDVGRDADEDERDADG